MVAVGWTHAGLGRQVVTTVLGLRRLPESRVVHATQLGDSAP